MPQLRNTIVRGKWAHTYERHHRDVPVLSVILRERSASPLMGGSTCGRSAEVVNQGHAHVLIRSMHAASKAVFQRLQLCSPHVVMKIAINVWSVVCCSKAP